MGLHLSIGYPRQFEELIAHVICVHLHDPCYYSQTEREESYWGIRERGVESGEGGESGGVSTCTFPVMIHRERGGLRVD